MTNLTDQTTETALQIVRDANIPVSASQRGSRVTVEVTIDGRTRRALVKTASIGNAMVNADIDDADKATLRAFEGFDDVLFAIGQPRSEIVQAFIVPADEVEQAYRDTHRHWRDTHPDKKNENLTWVLPFGQTKDPFLGGFGTKWAKYLIGQARRGTDGPAPRRAGSPQTSPHDNVAGGLSVEEAKRGLSLRYDVPIERIKIVIEH